MNTIYYIVFNRNIFCFYSFQDNKLLENKYDICDKLKIIITDHQNVLK